MDLKKKPQETAQSYIYRICKQKDLIGTWNDVCDVLNKELDRDWTESAYRKQFQAGLRYLDEIELEDNDLLEQIREEKELLFIERKKLQRVNQEHQANLRRSADYQLYKEMWLDAIADESPIKIINHSGDELEKVERTGVLCISDAHYGKVVELKGLDGEIVNSYSPEIFEARMWKLLRDFENDFTENIPIDRLIILDLGDCIEGILRCSKTLRSLKSGIIESANNYANFMAVWLCEVYNRLGIPVEYNLCGGNHDILRILGEKKQFDDENIARTICEKIHDRVEISKLKAAVKGETLSITVCDYGEYAFKSIYGVNLLGYHGDSRNLKEDIEFFENYCQVGVDILVAGHLHRNSQETIGYGFMGDREIIRVPSLIGTDEYSKSIKKLSRAGAFYMTFTPNGKDWAKTYFLN